MDKRELNERLCVTVMGYKKRRVVVDGKEYTVYEKDGCIIGGALSLPDLLTNDGISLVVGRMMKQRLYPELRHNATEWIAQFWLKPGNVHEAVCLGEGRDSRDAPTAVAEAAIAAVEEENHD